MRAEEQIGIGAVIVIVIFALSVSNVEEFHILYNLTGMSETTITLGKIICDDVHGEFVTYKNSLGNTMSYWCNTDSKHYVISNEDFIQESEQTTEERRQLHMEATEQKELDWKNECELKGGVYSIIGVNVSKCELR